MEWATGMRAQKESMRSEHAAVGVKFSIQMVLTVCVAGLAHEYLRRKLRKMTWIGTIG